MNSGVMSPIFKSIPSFLQQHARVLTLALFPALAVLLFLRAPYALLHPQFWAEDATVFFDQAAHLGIFSLAQTHAGYIHGIPRLTAWMASGLPAAAAPWIYGWCACLAALAALLLIARSSIGGHRALGPVAALAIAFVPHLSQEIFWSLTNVQWTVSAFLLLQLVSDPPDTRAATWLRTACSFLAGLTSPLSATLLVAWLWRLWFVRHNRQAWPLGAAFLAGLVQTAAIVARAPGSGGAPFPSGIACLEVIGRRVFIQGFLPAGFWPAASAHSVPVAVTGLVLLLGGILLARPQRPACLLLLAACALICAVSIARMAAATPKMLDPEFGGYGDRYFYPIRVSIILILLLLAFDGSRWPRRAAVVFLCLVPLAALPSFSAPPQPDREWGRYAALIDAGTPVDIPINPSWFGVYHYRPPKK